MYIAKGCFQIVRYIVDIPPEVVDEISKHSRTGKYRSIQDFIMAAVQNQLYIEQEAGSVNGSDLGTTSAGAADALRPQIDLLVPDVKNVQTLDSPSNSKVSDQIWGQFNRLFPVKISMRVLANMLKENGKGVSSEEAQEKAAREAQRIGRELKKCDDRLNRKRGDRLSAGLPFPLGKNEYKAITRFKMQFVGYPLVSKEGNLRIDGAPAVLRFVDIFKEDNNWMIGITKAGLKFASILNPILDRNDFSTPTVFSEEESNFLVEHIGQNLKSEAVAIKSILQSIKNGQNTPEKLNSLVKRLNREWTENKAVTMRAGLISRLSELGIVTRSKQGIRVTYSVTSFGNKALSAFER